MKKIVRKLCQSLFQHWTLLYFYFYSILFCSVLFYVLFYVSFALPMQRSSFKCSRLFLSEFHRNHFDFCHLPLLSVLAKEENLCLFLFVSFAYNERTVKMMLMKSSEDDDDEKNEVKYNSPTLSFFFNLSTPNSHASKNSIPWTQLNQKRWLFSVNVWLFCLRIYKRQLLFDETI